MNRQKTEIKSPKRFPKKLVRKPTPYFGVWTADEMEIRENWDFAAVPNEELIEALTHELQREVSRMHETVPRLKVLSRVNARIQNLHFGQPRAPYLKMDPRTRSEASEPIQPVLNPEKLRLSAAFLLPKEPLSVVGQGSSHREGDFSYPLNTFTSPTVGTGVVVMVDVTAVREAILMGQSDRILRSLLRSCGLPGELTKLPNKVPHFPWLQSLPDDDLRIGPALLLTTLGFARLLSADVEEEPAWTSAGFPEKWSCPKDTPSFVRLRHRRLKALGLHLEGMRIWMCDPARAVLRKSVSMTG